MSEPSPSSRESASATPRHATIQGELNNIFEMIGRMQKVDTEGVAPMTHAQGVALRLREDKVTEGDQRERFQAIAPQVEQGLYLVPKVIE